MEKFYSFKALLKMAGGGDASPTSPLEPPLLRCMTFVSNFAVRLSFQTYRYASK